MQTLQNLFNQGKVYTANFSTEFHLMKPIYVVSPGAMDAMSDYIISPAGMKLAQLTEVVSYHITVNQNPINALTDHAQEYSYYYR